MFMVIVTTMTPLMPSLRNNKRKEVSILRNLFYWVFRINSKKIKILMEGLIRPNSMGLPVLSLMEFMTTLT